MRRTRKNLMSNLAGMSKMRFRRILGLLLFVFLMNSSAMLLVAIPARATYGTVAIVNGVDGTSSFNFTTAQKNVGDTFLINITLTGTVNLSTWQVGIQWDNSLLGFVSMILPPDNIFADKSPIDALDSSTPGLVLMGANVGPEQTAFNGSGTMAQLTLIIKKAPVQGQTVETDINFEGIGSDTFLLGLGLSDISSNYVWNEAHYGYAGIGGLMLIHDIALTNVVPSSSSVVNGSSLNITVTIANTGAFTETFTVMVTANLTNVAPNETVTGLASGLSTTLTFVWNTKGWALGDYTVSATADLLEDPTLADNTLVYGVIHDTIPVEQPQIATIFADPSAVQSTAIGQNFIVNTSISNVVDLDAWQTGVTFNSTVLQCTGFYEGEFLKRSGMTVFAKELDMNKTLGGAALIGEAKGVNGSGQLARLTFTSVGIGVSDIHLTDILLLNSKLEDIPFEAVESFTVSVNGTNYGVEIVNNIAGVKNPASVPQSGVINTTFSMNDKKMSFDVLTTNDWFCQVTLPKKLLSCNTTSQWTVKTDGTPISYTATENATCTVLYFTYDKGNHTVEILGTNVIDENPQSSGSGPGSGQSPGQNSAPPPLLVVAAASLCLVTLMAALVDLRRTRNFKTSGESISKLLS